MERRGELRPRADEISEYTDTYFNKTRDIVGKFGDTQVTYAVFMRRPVISATRLALDWLDGVAEARGTKFEIDLRFDEGRWVGAGEPLMYITGSFHELVDLETLFLQKLGAACVAAYNAAAMCGDLPNVAFMAFDARHCSGPDMAELMAYAASVGSARADRKVGAIGFVGNATDATAHYFGQPRGLGTMPHALIGYAGWTVRAAEMFHETHPDGSLTVLVDYFGREISDSLEVCRRFPEMVRNGQMSLRLDTPGGRYIEDLDPSQSYAVLERHAPDAIRGYRTEAELRHLIGGGVSAPSGICASVSTKAGSKRPRSWPPRFGPEKCKVMAAADVPIDAIGTGSFLPGDWQHTYATSDIVEYGGTKRSRSAASSCCGSNSGTATRVICPCSPALRTTSC